MHIECCIPVSKRAPCGSKPSHIVLQVCCRVEEESRSDRSSPVSDAVLALSLHVLDHNWMAFIVLYTFVFRHLSTPLFAKSLCLRKLLFPSQLGDGGMKGWLGGCRWSLRGAALSLRSLFCQPSATDQQSASQACTDLIPLSLPFFLSLFLYFCLPLSRSPPLPEALAVPMSPSYANCLSCYQWCMTVWQPLCLPLCLLLRMPVSLAASLSVCLSVDRSSCLSAFASVFLSLCMGACLSICLSACQPLFLANTSLPESGQAVSRSANLPDYLPVYSSSVCVSICLPACLSACLPVCLSICLLAVYLLVLL